MALNPLLRLQFFTSANPPFVAGDELICYYDDVAATISNALNGTTLTNPTYNIQLGLSITFDVNDVPTINYSGAYLHTDGTDGDSIDLPMGIPPPPAALVPTADPIIPDPIVIPAPVTDPGAGGGGSGGNNDVIIQPSAPPQPTPRTRIPVTDDSTGSGGNGIDEIGYPGPAPTNFIP